MDNKKLEQEWMHMTYRIGTLNVSQLFQDISKSEFMVMDIIEKFMMKNEGIQGIYVSELAKRLKVSSPAVSRKLGLLEQKGYIGRDVDKKNRRNTYVFLTAKGITIKAEAQKDLCTFFDGVVDKMGTEDMGRLLSLCNQLLTIMEADLAAISERKRT